MKSRIRVELGPNEIPPQSSLRSRIDIGRNLLLTGAVALALCGATDALAKGGTAKPPVKNPVTAFITPDLAPPLLAVQHAATLHGFDATGFMQGATVDTDNTRCPGTPNQTQARINAGFPNLMGGTVTVNGVSIVVPCNMVIQMPANTLTWADFVNGAADPTEYDANGIKGFKTHGNTSPMQYEMSVTGNMVGTQNIAALMYVSQQSLNGNTGFITKIDYATGNIEVDNGTGGPATIQINDPNGRFGRLQSPDGRYSVDDENPTIHSGTGYPMCVPRTLTNPTVAGNPDDPLCPQINRPKANVTCRNFALAGVALPVSGDIALPAPGQTYCSAFVMPPVTAFGAIAGRLPTEPDARQQVPFEVGDYINYSGTLFQGADGSDYISAHTIEASVGIFTQPGTQPSYLAIGGFGVGTAEPTTVGLNGAGQEATNRIFLEAETTDVKTPVDIYYMDVNANGSIRNRWVTPFEMTGECNPAAVPVGSPLPAACYGATGGITTQNLGPQAARARIRAVKSPAFLLGQPSRTVRVVARSLCPPTQTVSAGIINTVAQDNCINNAPAFANGIVAGEYLAPVFEYIFPENVKVGDPIIAYDFWHLPFLRFGEGTVATGGIGPLEPAPW